MFLVTVKQRSTEDGTYHWSIDMAHMERKKRKRIGKKKRCLLALARP